MVNNIQLTWKLRTYRTCNSTGGFSKYEFYNKLFGDVILLEVTPSTHTYIYIHTHTQTDTHTTEHMLFIKKKLKKKKNNVFL